jgi:hypothetical protein
VNYVYAFLFVLGACGLLAAVVEFLILLYNLVTH